MTKTENFQLNQWDLEDRVVHTDFNEDNAKLDAALHALAQSKADTSALALLSTEVASKATATQLTSLQSTVSKVQTNLSKAYTPTNPCHVASYYVGDGNTTRTLSLPFTPLAVLVIPQTGYTYNSSSYMGGFTVPGVRLNCGLYIVTNGFQVACDGAAQSNKSSTIYCYIAFQ